MRPVIRRAVGLAAILLMLIAVARWQIAARVVRKEVPLPPARMVQGQRAEPAPAIVATPPLMQSAEPISPRVPELATGLLPWEAAVLEIERAPSGPGEKARSLFALLPQVPEDALLATTEQAAAWLRDADYTTVAAPLLLHPQTHGSVLSALFADLMQRPDAIAIPALLAVARDPAHPFAPQARENLALLLGQDRGADWSAWEAAIHQKLEPPRGR